MASLPARAPRRWTLKPPVGTPVNALSSLAQGLVAHWGMNDGGGTRLATLGSTDAPATVTGATWAWRANVAPLFQCPTFPGNTTDFFTVPHQAALSPVNKSVATWCLLTASPSVIQTFASKGNDWILRIDTNRATGWYVWTGGTFRALTGTIVPVGVPFFVVGTWDGTTMRLYQNGRQQVTSTPGGGATTTGTSPVSIGGDGVAADSLYGALGMVTLWNRALTPAEVMELYVNPLALWAPPRPFAVTSMALAAVPPVGYLHYCNLALTNTSASTLGGSLTTPVAAGGTDYVVRVALPGADAATTSILATATDHSAFRDVTVWYNNAGTLQQIDTDYDPGSRGVWNATNGITLHIRLQAPLAPSATTPDGTLFPGGYVLAWGNASPVVKRDWRNIYPFSDDFNTAATGQGTDSSGRTNGAAALAAQWTNSGVTVSCAASVATLTAVTSQSATGPSSYGTGYAAEMFGTMPIQAALSGVSLAFRAGVTTPFVDFYSDITTTSYKVRNDNTGVVSAVVGTHDNATHLYLLARDATGLARAALDANAYGTLISAPGGQLVTVTLPVSLTVGGAASNTGTLTADWVKVRPWVTPEPTAASGTIQTGSGVVVVAATPAAAGSMGHRPRGPGMVGAW